MDSQFMNMFLQNFMMAAIPVVVPALAALVIAGVRKLWSETQSRAPDVAYYIREAAKISVSAAEQSGAAGFIKDKKEYALELAEAWLAEQKITVDVRLIEAAIEAAVYDEINKPKLAE